MHLVLLAMLLLSAPVWAAQPMTDQERWAFIDNCDDPAAISLRAQADSQQFQGGMSAMQNDPAAGLWHSNTADNLRAQARDICAEILKQKQQD